MALPSPRPRLKLAVAVGGQSTEHGPVSTSQKLTYMQCFRSQRNPSVAVPLAPAVGLGGGWLIKVHDDLYDARVDPTILNGAIGGVSAVKEVAGMMGSRGNDTPYYGRRAPLNSQDRGYAGDFVQSGGGAWCAVEGDVKIALGAGPNLSATPGRGDGYLDSLTTHAGVRVPGLVAAQSLTIIGSPTGGNFTLQNPSNSNTAVVAQGASAGTTQTAVRTLGGAYSAATVTLSGSVYTVVPNPGTPASNPLLTLSANALTGGTAPTVIITGNAFANYKTGASSPFPADAVLSGYPRGYRVTEVPLTSANPGVTWEFQGFINGTPPNGIGGQGTYPLAGTVFTESQSGMGFDPLGILQRLHEELQRVKADRKLVYWANGQSDLGFASTTPGTVCTQYRDALISIGNFFLNRGYEFMLGFTSYSPASSAATTVQWDNLVLARNAALTTLQAGADGARVYAGANLYALMGTTGPMAPSGGYMEADNIHLNGRGCIGPALSGVQPAGYHVANAIKAVL